MNWKTKRLLLAVFGGISIITYALIFATDDTALKLINLGTCFWSFITALILKVGVAVHG